MLASLTALGAPPEVVAAQLAEQAEFELWPQHEPAWRAFILVCHQWRYRPDGVLIGLDYPSLEAGLRLAGATLTAREFYQLRIIEAEIINTLSAKHGQ